MRRRARYGLVLAALSAALTLAAPSPAPALVCNEPFRQVCSTVCRIGQRLGFECLASETGAIQG